MNIQGKGEQQGFNRLQLASTIAALIKKNAHSSMAAAVIGETRRTAAFSRLGNVFTEMCHTKATLQNTNSYI